MGQRPSIPSDLTPKLRVIGAGCSRTGTVSLAHALERLLGGPVNHSGTAMLLREEDYIKSWIKIQKNNCPQPVVEKTLRELTLGYTAITDNPAIQFTKELVDIYPDAIVICQTRDQESWWRSHGALMKKANGLWWLDILFLPMGTLRYFGSWKDAIAEKIRKNYSITSPEQEALLMGPELLSIHESYVKCSVPPERLFSYNVKDGWGPLCKILNCPVPDEPFPRANDGPAMDEFFEKIVKASIVRWLQIFAVSGTAVAAALYAFRK